MAPLPRSVSQKVKRSPDAGVASAVQSLQKNQKFKRMMIFGLRSLSDFCVPPTIKYKENALAALELECVEPLVVASESYSDDPDVILTTAKIIWGISETLADELQDNLTEIFTSGGGVTALLKIINSKTCDDDILGYALNAYKTLVSIGVTVDASSIAGGLLAGLNPKMKPAMAVLITSTLLDAANASACDSLDGEAATKLLKFAIGCTSTSNAEMIQAVEKSLMVVKAIAEKKKTSTEHLDLTMQIIDGFKAKKTIVNQGSATMSAMMGPDLLKACMKDLESAKSGPKEKQAALVMLSSMSYISEYANAIAKSDGIPLLCAAVKDAAEELAKGSKDTAVIRGLTGAAKMLGRITHVDDNIQLVEKGKGLENLVMALKQCQQHGEAAAACCLPLANLVKQVKNAKQFDAIGGFATLFQLLEKTKSDEMQAMGVAIIAQGAHPDVAEKLSAAMPIICAASGCQQDNLEFQSDVFTAVRKLTDAVPDGIKQLRSTNAIKHMSTVFQANVNNESLVSIGLEMFSKLKDISPEDLRADGTVTDAVLKIMLTHPNHAQKQRISLSLLEAVATEEDARRCLIDLEKSINAARTNSDRCLVGLAAVNGLSQISRLSQVLKSSKCDEIINKAIKMWIEGTKFNLQQTCIQAAAQSLQKFLCSTQGSLQTSIVNTLNTCMAPNMRSLIDRQDPLQDNSLLDILYVVEHLTGLNRIEKDEISDVIDAVMKLMKKYPDLRKVNVSCINILTALASAFGGEGARQIMQQGACKTVIAYMQKVIIYEDVQVSSYQLLEKMLRADRSLADGMKRSGAIDCIKVSTRQHANNQNVRKYIVPVAAILMPSDEVERQIIENAGIVKKSAESDSLEVCIDALKNLSNLTVGLEGAKVAARVGVAAQLNIATQMCVRRRKAKPACVETTAAASEIASVMNNVAQTRQGCAHLIKNEGLSHLVDIFETLDSGPDIDKKRQGQDTTLQCMRRLMRHDNTDHTIMYKRGMVPQICSLVSEYEEDDNILLGAAGCLSTLKANHLAGIPAFGDFVAKLIATIQTNPDRTKKLSALNAFDEMMYDGDAQLIDLVVKKKACIALYAVVDNFPDDPALLQKSLRCLNQIGKFKNLRTYFRESGQAGLPTIVGTCRRALQKNKMDADTCTGILDFVNKCTTQEDRGMLLDSGILDEVQDLLYNHEHEPLRAAAAELLGKLGAEDMIKSLIKQIIDTCDTRPTDYGKKLMKLNQQLGIFINADIKDPMETFKDGQKCINSLASVLAEQNQDVPLMTSIANVTRRIIDKFWGDDNAIMGPKTITPKMMGELGKKLTEMHQTKAANKKFLCDAYRVLAGVGSNPKTNPDLVKMVNAENLLPTSKAFLTEFQNDSEVVARIMEFLACLAATPEGAKQLTTAYTGKKSKNMGDDLLSDISTFMNHHRANVAIVAAGLQLCGNLFGMDQKKVVCPMLVDATFVREMEEHAQQSPQALGAFIDMQKQRIPHMATEEKVAALKRIQTQFQRTMEDSSIPDEQKMDLAQSLAGFVENLSPDVIKKADILDDFVQNVEQTANDATTLGKTCRALESLAAADADISAKIARNTCNLILTAGLPALAGDPVALKEALHLLEKVCENEGNGRIIAKTQGFKNLETTIQQLVPELEREDAQEIQMLAESIRRKIEADNPENLTVQQVYAKWKQRKDNGEGLNLNTAEQVMRHLDFVCDNTEEYGKEHLKDTKEFTGSEFMYGCKALSLLHEYPENSAFCIERNEPKFILHAIKNQKNDNIGQWACATANDAVQYADAADEWTLVDSANKITANALQRGRKLKGEKKDCDQMLITRMTLMERLAVNRTFYNGTDCMAALIGIWDDYDSGTSSVDVLIQVFRSMRKIVNDHWVNIILKNKVPKRLIDVVDDVNADPRLLVDVFFLLGTLAVVPEIKTLIGELNGVESCLELLRRYHKSENPTTATATLTNGCLALANVTIGHGPNINRFVRAKGIELDIEILNKSMEKGTEFDVANGAAVLMCNTCFKRDDMKELFGKKGAVEAIMETIHKYDGSQDFKAFRCLGSMFKAIANLALFTPNVTNFLEQHVEKTFAHFYKKSKNMPDWLVEVSLRTVSNLVLENMESNMERFGAILEPLLKLLMTQKERNSIAMFTMAFEVLGMMSRLPANALKFCNLDGIPCALGILNSNADDHLYASGVYVLGIQTTHPLAVKQLVKFGVFTFITSILDAQCLVREMNTDLTIAALRCARRILTDKSSCKAFVEQGGIQSALAMLGRSDTHTMVHMDIYRLLIAVLVQMPNPPRPKLGSKTSKKSSRNEWDCSDIAEEGVNTETLDRPPSPRSWEQLGLTSAQISRLIVSVCDVLGKEEAVKQHRFVRCALGLLAYFACEKIENCLQAFYQASIGEILEKVIKEHLGDPDVIHTACYLINNVAYGSEPEMYLELRRPRELRSQLERGTQAIPRDKKEAFDFCQLTSKLLAEKNADPSRFEVHLQWDFPLELTLYDQDKYPNGVQDLPTDLREEIRAGGKFKICLDEKTKEVFQWKASMDMGQFQWRCDAKEGIFPYQMAVSAIRTIGKGRASKLFAAMDESSMLFRTSEAITLMGPPVDGYPEGVELNILCGTGRARDRFFNVLSEWRDAATFGF